MRNQTQLITVCAVSLVLLLLMPAASAVKIVVNASYDGGVGSDEKAPWFTMRNAEGNSVLELWSKVYSGMTESNNTPEIYENHWRGLVTWDTSAIPDDAIITSATVSVYGVSQMNEIGTVNFSIVDATPSDQSAYVEEDYSRTTFTRFADDTPSESYKKFAWNNITLNSLGLTNISKTGLTTFMFTHSADVDNSSLTWVGGPDPDGEEPASGFYFRGVNYTDTPGDYKPYFTINYNLRVVPPVASFTPNVTSGTSPLTVKFTDTSTNSPSSWNWSFGDGNWFNTTVAAERNATHTYTTPTTYTARLTVANAGGSNTTSPGTTIAVNAVPTLTMDKIGICKDGAWYLDNDGSGTWNGGDQADNFGAPGWTPIVGDWNATVFTYIGVTNGQQWYLDWNGNGAWDGGDKAYSFGAPGWTPIVGDWNATGFTNIGVTNGQQWYLDWNGNGAWDGGDKAYSFGAPGWTPVVGNWNNDRKTDIGVTNGQQWYLDWNGTGAWDGGDKAYSFGAPGWIPVVGDWNTTGFTYIGVTNGQQWYLDWNGTGAWDGGDKAYSFGAPGWTPVVGKWN